MKRLRSLVVLLSGFVGVLVVVPLSAPVGAGTAAGCMPIPESVTWDSPLDVAIATLPDGTLVVAEGRVIDPIEPIYATTIDVGSERLEIAAGVDRLVAADDGSLWISTGGFNPLGSGTDLGIGVFHWTPDSGLAFVPGTEGWFAYGVDADGRALMGERFEDSYRWVTPDGVEELLPGPAAGESITYYEDYRLVFSGLEDGDTDNVVLFADGRQRDVSAELEDRRGVMHQGDRPVILKGQSVLVLGIDETVEYPIEDPTLSLRLVGHTSTSVFLARFGPAAEVFDLDLTSGTIESRGFGPEGSRVAVFADDDIWFFPVVGRQVGDLFRNQIQRPAALPYDPSFVGESERSDRIERLYLAYFQRQPDAVGLDFWRRSTLSGAAMAESFARSEEFTDTYGFLSSGEFVDLIYLNVLGRAPDPDGREFWIQQQQRNGSSSRGSVMLSFAESPEFIAVTGTDAPSRPLDGSIERLYQAYFGRSPDQGGLCFWTDQILVDGQALEVVSADFERSPEFVSLYGALDDEAFIDLVYRNVLGRSPDAAGAAFWLDALGSDLTRGALMLQFAESAEFKVVTDTL